MAPLDKITVKYSAHQRVLIKTILLLVLALPFLSGCATQRPRIAPGARLEQAPLPPEDEVHGHAVLSDLVERFPLSRDRNTTNRAREIVERITEGNGLADNPWHVYVLEGGSIKNAGATRGNFIFVFTGLLDLVEDDEELAAVVAHEIAHVLARHTLPDPGEDANRMITGVMSTTTREVLSAQGQAGVVVALAELLVSETVKGLIVNPDTQRKELEADHIGLFLMARAGFNPEAALRLWERVEKDPSLSGSIEFFSSHPAAINRLEQLRELLPLAAREYQRSISAWSLNRPEPRKPERVGPKGSEVWVVVEPYTAVFRDPSRAARVSSELPAGTEVRVLERQGKWLRIDLPKPGFVFGPDLAPKI